LLEKLEDVAAGDTQEEEEYDDDEEEQEDPEILDKSIDLASRMSLDERESKTDQLLGIIYTPPPTSQFLSLFFLFSFFFLFINIVYLKYKLNNNYVYIKSN
jgi:hypothetical protein